MIIDFCHFVNVYFHVLFKQKSLFKNRLFLCAIHLEHSSIIVYYNSNKEREWLFFTDNNCLGDTKYIGKSVVKLNSSNTRGNINIAPNANELLLDYIKKHENNTNRSFVDFLSQARWIHISSLNNINHFCEIMEYIKKAKKKNRYLQVSVDPGDEYTRRYQDQIQKYLKIADYVFLNKKEYNNLVLNESFAFCGAQRTPQNATKLSFNLIVL